MSRRFDVAVVGSGIVGLGAAYAAARRGKSVLVVDHADQPHGASVRNFGHIGIAVQAGRAREYADVARGLWITLAREAGFWLRPSGTIIAARHADELAVLEAAAVDDDIELIDADAVREFAPVRDAELVGGAHVLPDLQVNPREALGAVRSYLERIGVTFWSRTHVTGVSSGTVETSHGVVRSGLVVVAVGHDLDRLLPEIANDAGIERCQLDMIRVRADLDAELRAPLLTGWSMTRYGRFADLDETVRLRTRLHRERPDLAAIELNQMYTQLPDGSVIVGDSHRTSVDAVPFQSETTAELILDEMSRMFGIARPQVIERWRGVYASARDDFLVREIAEGVHVLAVTTGIGMTTGLGLAETTLTPILGDAPPTPSGEASE